MSSEKTIEEQFREKSTEDLRKGIALARWGSSSDRNDKMARLILSERERGENKKRFEKTLELAEKNVRMSKHLAIATWGLVLVTLLLVVFTAMSRCAK